MKPTKRTFISALGLFSIYNEPETVPDNEEILINIIGVPPPKST
jgi:hypothetical protein